MLCALAAGQACYVYTPAPLQPAPGTHLAFGISDRGALNLSDSLGAGVEKIGGILRAPSDSAFHISVVSVEYRKSPLARWSGEPLALRRDYVTDIRQRTFSRSRTFLAVGGITGATLAFALSRGLLGGGTTPADRPPNPPGGEQ